MAEKVKNVYEFDYERTSDRVSLILKSFQGAPDVDEDLLAKADMLFAGAFETLRSALKL